MINIHGLIPARGGSKGIPDKNLTPLMGIPLIDYTIHAAQESGVFTDVTVSSDDEKILKHSKAKGVSSLRRPDAISQDLSSADEVISHFIDSAKPQNEDVIIYLQPTSPLRKSQHIREAIDLFQKHSPNMVMSVFRPEHHPLKCFKKSDDGHLVGFISPDAPFQPRQNLPEVFNPNGAIYIFSVKAFLKSNKIPRDNIYPYLMSQEDSVDIDHPQDLLVASFVLKKDRL